MGSHHLWQPDTRSLKAGPGVQGRPTREQRRGGHFLPSRRELSHVAEQNQKEGESPWEPIPWSSRPFISTVSVQPVLSVPCTPVLLQANFRKTLICFSAPLTQVESESEVTQSCQILCDPMDCSLPGSSIHGIFQARIQEWVAISFSRRDRLKFQYFTQY